MLLKGLFIMFGFGKSRDDESTVETIAHLQAQYDRLQAEGARQLGGKARREVEKRLHAEMLRKLAEFDGGADEFKRVKGDVARQLQAAKVARRGEISDGVAGGTISADDAEREIISLGWETGVARQDVKLALEKRGSIEKNAVHVDSKASIAAEPPTVTVAGDAEPVVIDTPPLVDGGTVTIQTGPATDDAAPLAQFSTDAAPPPSADEPLVTAGAYASTSNGDIGALLEANAQAVQPHVPADGMPTARKDLIALLVAAGVRPAKKSK